MNNNSTTSNVSMNQRIDLYYGPSFLGLATLICVICIINGILQIRIQIRIKDFLLGTATQYGQIAVTSSLLCFCKLVDIYFTELTPAPSKHGCFVTSVFGVFLFNVFLAGTLWEICFVLIQRFMCFKYPFKTLGWYKSKRFIVLTYLVLLGAFLSQIPYLVVLMIYCANRDPMSKVSSEDIFIKTEPTSLQVLNWFNVVIIYIIPVSIQLTMNVFLLQVLRENFLRRRKLLRQLKEVVLQLLKESTSLFLSITTLLVEIPLVILLILSLLHPNAESDKLAICILFLMIVFMLYFSVHLCCRKKFRIDFQLMFKTLFVCNRANRNAT